MGQREEQHAPVPSYPHALLSSKSLSFSLPSRPRAHPPPCNRLPSSLYKPVLSCPVCLCRRLRRTHALHVPCNCFSAESTLAARRCMPGPALPMSEKGYGLPEPVAVQNQGSPLDSTPYVPSFAAAVEGRSDVTGKNQDRAINQSINQSLVVR